MGKKIPAIWRQQLSTLKAAMRNLIEYTMLWCWQEYIYIYIYLNPKIFSAQNHIFENFLTPPQKKKKTVHLLFGFNPRHAHLGTKLLLFHPALGTGLGRASWRRSQGIIFSQTLSYFVFAACVKGDSYGSGMGIVWVPLTIRGCFIIGGPWKSHWLYRVFGKKSTPHLFLSSAKLSEISDSPNVIILQL